MTLRFHAPAFVCFVASFASLGAASADEISGPTSQNMVMCRFKNGEGGCSQFEGYVFVHRDAGGAQGVSVGNAPSGDAALNGQRLYLGVSSQSLR